MGPDDSRPPRKKIKTGARLNDQQQHAEPQSTSAEMVQESSPTANVDLVQSSILPPELAQLESKYEFATMSIISSVKIEQKVRSLLAHMDRFNHVDVHCKSGVVALHAKANVAQKMISIVEIAKRGIENTGGHWWQYSRCHSDLRELVEKEVVARKRDALAAKDTAGAPRPKGPLPVGKDGMDLDEADEEEAFEAMSPKQVATHVEARKKVRAVAVMTIYMSRVPIPEFTAIYRYGKPDHAFSFRS